MLNGVLPAFDIDRLGWSLALVRGLAVAGLMSTFGTLAFRHLVAAPALRRATPAQARVLDQPQLRLARRSIGTAAALLVLWLALQTAAITGGHEVATILGALPDVVAATRFGHLVTLQLASLLVVAVVATGRWPAWIAMLASALPLALQAGHGHAAAMQAAPSVLLGAGIVHLLAAGAWAGGLWPLLSVVRDAPPAVGASACRYFSPMGKWCVAAVLASAGVQFWELIGGIPGLVGTAYGEVALIKMALFAALFGFALANRYRLAPRLLGPDPASARRSLMRSIGAQTGVGLAAVLAAGLLSALPPSMHTQPVWPFTEQFSLVVVEGDSEVRAEVLRALAAMAGAAAIVALGTAWRRRRWFALLSAAVATLLVLRAAPSLGLLLVPAGPTSFYRSPTGFAVGSIAAGAALYGPHCASCHGFDGRGSGPRAKGLALPPADLTAPHLWDHADGELFGWLAQGMQAPAGELVMPGFSPALSDDDLWALIDAIRAHNAGAGHAATGAWSPPIPAPSFQLTCAEGNPTELADLRGRSVRLVFGRTLRSAGEQDPAGLVTIMADGNASERDACVVDDGAIRAAYAIVLGEQPEAMSGIEVLIDPAGWLREAHRAENSGPAEQAWLAAALQAIAGHPVTGMGAVDGGMNHRHH